MNLLLKRKPKPQGTFHLFFLQEWKLEGIGLVFTRKEFRWLNKFKRIYLLVSGGRDSTYTFLKFIEHQYWIKKPITLLYTDTGNEIPSALNTIKMLEQAMDLQNEKLPEKLQWNSLVLQAKAILPEKPMFYIKKAFLNLNKAWEIVTEKPDKYSKKIFPCCWYLKHKIFEVWIKENGFQNNEFEGIFVSSIRPGESLYRRRFLLRLKQENTHFLFKKREKVWYYYPLRDITVKEVNTFLQQGLKFSSVKHSGCKVCPILVLFQLKFEGERYERSMKVYEHLIAKGLLNRI